MTFTRPIGLQSIGLIFGTNECLLPTAVLRYISTQWQNPLERSYGATSSRSLPGHGSICRSSEGMVGRRIEAC